MISVLEGGYGCMPGGTMNFSKPGAFATRSQHQGRPLDVPISPNARDALDRVRLFRLLIFSSLLNA